MDPLSIIASIAGIATAGSSLSKTIYHFISSTRGASREMADIARNISDLSCILSELRRVLQESADLCSHKLLRQIKSVTRRISAIHDDIYALMDSTRGFQTFRWSLKRSEVQYKLTLIESHKTAIQLMLNILILAATTRKEAQCQIIQTTSTSEGKQKEPESEVLLLRQQSENIAYAASHCLIDLSENHEFETGQPKTDYGSENDDATGQVQIRDHGPSDGQGRWLFELVFESYSGNCQDSETQDHDMGNEHGVSAYRTALAVRTPEELQIAIYKPGEGQHLIDILLADWTCPSKDQITGTFGMQELIRQAFVQVEALYLQVLAGQYSLNGPDGNLIHPLSWESTVEPGMQVVMVMSILPISYPEKSKPNPETEKVNVPTRRQEKLKSKYTKAIVFNPKRMV
ncbi:hypothetical protein FPHYL_743 [Fusarium phyllophilum]|uniref:Ubiquitin-like domain-containing protein n=1 Tax=Fusarium phyllophilum TaxID=47803 RepID=A0A8H5KE92_9HYPO|nr:hypothetical protein FPHYL_743 [Fusarium phyllophilum]